MDPHTCLHQPSFLRRTVWLRAPVIFVVLALMFGAAGTSSVAATAGNTLRIAVGDWIPGLGNPYASTINGSLHPFLLMFDTLTRIGADGKVLPHLAESWRNESPTEWTFILRQGVKFANGEPLDAAAVVAMIEWLKKPEAQRYVAAVEVKDMVAVRALDDVTVRITTRGPDPLLLKRLSLLMVVPPRYWAEVGPEKFTQAPIGSGPFALLTWGRDRGRFIIVRSPSWRPGGVLERIEFLVLPDAGRRTQSLITGEAEIALNIDFAGRDELQGNGIPAIVRPSAVVAAIALPNNRSGSPLSDVRVRQALNYGVDRAAIARVLLADAVAPSSQGLAPGVFGYAPDAAAYPYDPAKAKALLASAGYGKGLSLVLAALTKTMVEGDAIYQRVAQDLAKIGVAVEIRSLAGTDWVSMWMTGNWRGADMLTMVWNGGALMDAGRAIEPFTCAKSGAFFCDPAVDKAIAQSGSTMDPAVREQQLRGILQTLQDQAPSLYLFPQVEILGVSPRITQTPFVGRYLDLTAIAMKP